jgi:uncharacterized protein (DUF2237 family)
MKHTNTNIIILLCIIIVVLAGMAIKKRMSRRKKRKTRRGGGKENFQTEHKNILGTALIPCSKPPDKTTGFYRDGKCSTGPTDAGTHVVCAVVDDEFLTFTKSKGNDLTTPQNSFPGLVAGDKWCLCALRWREAYAAGKAPKIIPESTSDAVTQYVPKEILINHAI